MKTLKSPFFRAAILSAAAFFFGPQAIAQDRASTVEFEGVNCNPEDGADVQILLNNYSQAKARVIVTDINGRVHQVEEDIRMNESLEGLTRSQLEQLANTASEDEGQNVYRQALDEIGRAEQYCRAQKTAAPASP